MTDKTKRIKKGKSVSLSPYLLKRAEELVEKKEFSSISDVVSTAISQFFTTYDAHKQEPEDMKRLLSQPFMKYALIFNHKTRQIEAAEDIRKRLGIPEPEEPVVTKP